MSWLKYYIIITIIIIIIIITIIIGDNWLFLSIYKENLSYLP
jgi:hypothetical protein